MDTAEFFREAWRRKEHFDEIHVHMPGTEEELVNSLKHIHSMLKPGGLVFALEQADVLNRWGEQGSFHVGPGEETIEHNRALQREIESAGFRILRAQVTKKGYAYKRSGPEPMTAPPGVQSRIQAGRHSKVKWHFFPHPENSKLPRLRELPERILQQFSNDYPEATQFIVLQKLR